jgi:hypothetical protein
MASEGIPLQDVPNHFFDPGKWKELIQLCGGAQQALRQLSIPCLASFAAQLNAPEITLANSLVERFRTALLKGEYIVTGYDPEERCSMEFQPEDWERYGLNFAEDRAFWAKRTFTHIRVFRRVDLPESGKVLDKCVSWLRELKSKGEVKGKKVLEREAFERFGSDLTTRTFAAAYKTVFNKKRGRPRKEERE